MPPGLGEPCVGYTITVCLLLLRFTLGIPFSSAPWRAPLGFVSSTPELSDADFGAMTIPLPKS